MCIHPRKRRNSSKEEKKLLQRTLKTEHREQKRRIAVQSFLERNSRIEKILLYKKEDCKEESVILPEEPMVLPGKIKDTSRKRTSE